MYRCCVVQSSFQIKKFDKFPLKRSKRSENETIQGDIYEICVPTRILFLVAEFQNCLSPAMDSSRTRELLEF